MTPLAGALTVALGIASMGGDAHAGGATDDGSRVGHMHALRLELAHFKQQLQPDPRVIALKRSVPHPLVPKPAGIRATAAVSSCVDDANSATTSGTLRYAVINAGESETIDLGSLRCSSITLTQGALPVSVDNLTVTGPSAATFAIDGGGSDRVFDHGGDGTLELDYLTVRSGFTSNASQPGQEPQPTATSHGGRGGCVYSSGAVDLDHSTVTGCTASSTDASSEGGGVAAHHLYMESATISANTVIAYAGQGAAFDRSRHAAGGGAYAYYASLSGNSAISGNRAEAEGGFSFGGGLTARFANISDSVVSGNTSRGVIAIGGGISAYRGLYLSGSTLSGNTVYGIVETGDDSYPYANAFGGGAISECALHIQHSTVSGNVARTNADRYNGAAVGGGIVASYYAGANDTGAPPCVSGATQNSGLISVSYSTIDNNQADFSGGMLSKYAMTLVQSTISGNRAQFNGGGIGFATNIASKPSHFYNSTIANNSAGRFGGGIDLSYSPLTMSSTIVAANSAATGAGIFAYLEHSTGGSLTGSTVQQADMVTVGGSNDLVMNSANVTLPGDTLTANPLLQALAFNGGPTRTQRLSTGSPAIGTGSNPNSYPYDQRGNGYARSAAGLTNIGAVQAVAAPAAAMTPTPTLSTWGLALLGGLLGWVGLRPREKVELVAKR